MELSENPIETAASSSSTSTAHPSQDQHPESSQSRALRSSARVKAAKQKAQDKGKGKDSQPAEPATADNARVSTSRAPRSNKRPAKAKAGSPPRKRCVLVSSHPPLGLMMSNTEPAVHPPPTARL